MKIQRLVALCALGALIISCVSASADERLGHTTTSLTSTTISGYVDTAVTAVEADHQPANWWHSFLIWFGFHSR